MRSLAVVVPKEKAEDVRRKLLAVGALRTGVAVEREGDVIHFPVLTQVDVGFPVEEREFRESFVPIRSYKDVANVPAELKPLLPTSFDVVGDIAIIRIPDELARFEGEIADAILQANMSVKVVAADAGVKGPLRIRDLRVLRGPNRTETVHRECGLSFLVDAAKAYFSPRLGTERMRVADQVQPGEVVVDMFAGVGPYAILIAKRRAPQVVYAFDANPDGFRYLEENVRRNRAERVEARLGDGLQLLAGIEPPNRVIIDYPQDPEPAQSVAVSKVRLGGTIHYYEILEEAERPGREEWLATNGESLGRRVDVVGVRAVHGWSPTKKLFGFDLCVT